ncbi:hypothetical protein NOJ28_11180 [Neorhizobium galegae]|uniref:hypothetical protein n=1 Tax=Neorhizobium galegae TaxID=399 RepID=UPI0021085835|nr:hypothetical protein [Neorhizobium galegae]MCQ1766098.1 hypothetical protein [Neorhizobium galegae]MCQ1845012.1 hypothetical protein [Neorhizobium galegae]
MSGELLIAFAGDFLSSVGFGASGGATKGAELALKRVLQKRAESARSVLIEEIRAGRSFIHEVGEDQAAAITFRYMRAGIEGAARRNLRLLASIAAGQGAETGLYADEFLRWADALSGLGRAELIVLGVMQRMAEERDYQIPRTGDFWMDVVRVLSQQYDIDPGAADASAGACLRTGLLTILGGLMDIGHAYLPSVHLKEIGRLTKIEVVLRRDENL